MRAQLRQQDGVSVLRLHGVPLVLVNALRRCILRDVATLAVTRVRIKANCSNFWDEYISHRIALLPFCGSPGRVRLNVTATSPQPETVMSAAIEGTATTRCALSDVPLLRLMEGQTLHLEADVGYGSGQQHARFAPGVCWITDAGEEEYDLHLDPRDGLDAVAIFQEGLMCMERVVDRMLTYDVLSTQALGEEGATVA